MNDRATQTSATIALHTASEEVLFTQAEATISAYTTHRARHEEWLRAEGRVLAYECYGDPMGHPVFFFHGSPGSGREGYFLHEAATTYGLHIIAPERPGMGRSSYVRDYTLLDWAEDIAGLADHLRYEKFGVIGVSGGGAPVLACAHQMPERLCFAVDMAGWAPLKDKALAAQMAPLDRMAFAFAQKMPLLTKCYLAILGWTAKRLPYRWFKRLLSSYFSAADRAWMERPTLGAFFQQDVVQSFAQGSRGPAQDALLQFQEWGFSLTDIEMPIYLFHGETDKLVPPVFSSYKAEQLPQAKHYVFPEQGHYYLMLAFDQVFSILQQDGLLDVMSRTNAKPEETSVMGSAF